MLVRENGDRIGANLVRGVAIGGDAVGAHDRRLDSALRHHDASHVVADERGRNAVFHQLPGGQPGALQEGTGFVGENV